jgi:hypothetical protein
VAGPAAASDAQTIFVSFPLVRDGKLFTGYKNYQQEMLANPSLHRARVIYSDPVKDLALLQVPQLPPHVEPLPLAKQGSQPGQNVHSVGNPGASDSSWIYTSGTVRTAPYGKRWISANALGESILNHDAVVIETQSPINSGDSGGPLVNDLCELVAVTQGSNRRAELVNFFIDVSEVKTLLQSKGYRWVEGRSNLSELRPAISSGDAVRLTDLLRHSSPRVRIRAASYLADAGEQGRIAVAALTKAIDDEDAEVRRSVVFALGTFGVEALPGLRKALHDASPEVRKLAVQALVKLGPDAKGAVPELTEMFKDKDRDVATLALEAVLALGPRRRGAGPGQNLARSLLRRTPVVGASSREARRGRERRGPGIARRAAGEGPCRRQPGAGGAHRPGRARSGSPLSAKGPARR